MRGCRRTIGLIATVLLLGAVPTPSAAAEPDLTARLDRVIADKVAEMDVPGALVSVVVPGSIDYERAIGVADTVTGEPLTLDHHTRIGSVTKTFTGTAVLQLVDQGRIRLTDPISRYVDGVPNGDRITLNMLGRMRSGLFDYSEDEQWVDEFFAQAPTGPDAFAYTPRRLLAVAFAHPPNFAPDTDYQYSNTNTVLLALVVETVTGLPFGEYLQRFIFAPTGLWRTSYPVDGALPAPFAHGYISPPGGGVQDATFWNPSWADAAGKIVSTTADLRTWAKSMGTGALLQPGTQARRLADPTMAAPGAAYGFAIFDSHGWIGHNGDIPGYTTVLVYLPARDATLAVSVNSDVPENHAAGQIATAVTEIVTPQNRYDLAGT
ncbi:serine hydrolase domain-containing protein [Mycobacterium sp. NPDC003323]